MAKGSLLSVLLYSRHTASTKHITHNCNYLDASSLVLYLLYTATTRSENNIHAAQHVNCTYTLLSLGLYDLRVLCI